MMAFSFRLNPGGDPGDRQIEGNVLLWNLLIMLFGEIVVTDGLIQPIARKFTTRYVFDPGIQWKRTKNSGRRFLLSAGVLMVGRALQVVAPVMRGALGAKRQWLGRQNTTLRRNVHQSPSVGTK